MSGKGIGVMGKAEFLRQAAAAYDRVVEEDQEQMRTFTQIEDRVLEVRERLGQSLMGECLARRGQAEAQDGAKAVCPKCGREVAAARSAERPREVLGRAGPVVFRRAEYRCPSCRKVFSPSG